MHPAGRALLIDREINLHGSGEQKNMAVLDVFLVSHFVIDHAVRCPVIDVALELTGPDRQIHSGNNGVGVV